MVTFKEDFEDTSSLWNFSFTGGTWSRVTSPVYEGSYSYKSCDIGDSGSTSFTFSVSIPTSCTNASLAVYYYIDSEANYDFIKLYVDGVVKASDSGQPATWKNFNIPLTSANHTIKIEYMKDTSSSVGGDCVYIDNITLSYIDSPTQTINKRISQTSHDGCVEFSIANTFVDTNTQVLLGNTGTTPGTGYMYEGYFYFPLINIPYGSTINSAYLNLTYSYTTSNISVWASLYAEKVANPTCPSSYSSYMGKTTLTSAKVDINIRSTLSDGVLSFDVADIIRELISLSGWVSGNSIDFLLKFTAGYNSMIYFHDYSGNPLKSANVVIDYSPPNTPPTTPGAITQPASGTVLQGGNTYTLSWNTSSDVGSSSLDYYIECQKDSGSWVSAGSISAPIDYVSGVYEYTIGSDITTSIRFRVRAKDSGGLYSEYSYSPVYSVVSITINPPTIISPLSAGSTINKRPKIRVNVPTNSLGARASQVKLSVKNGTSLIETQTIDTQSSTLIMTPSLDYLVGTLTVELSAYSGSIWSSVATYSFTIVNVTNFSVLEDDTSISVGNYNVLKELINNSISFRGVSSVSMDSINTDTLIKATHLTIMRDSMVSILSGIGITPSWTDPNVVPNVTLRKGTHWIEIFNYLKQV